MSTRDLSVDFGSAQTGVAFKLFTSAGTLGVAVTAGIVNLASGMYFKPDVEIGANRGVYWYCDTAGVEAFEMFNAQDSGFTGDDRDNLADIADRIATGVVTVISPVSDAGDTLSLIHGDDYLDDDGRALSFTSEDWPVLTAGAAVLKIGDVLTAAGDITNAATVSVELTHAQTILLKQKNYPFALIATLANGHVATLARGTAVILKDPPGES